MTEEEWLRSDNPETMREFVWSESSLRKRRFAAVACCHRLKHLIPDQFSQAVLDLAEQVADEPKRDLELAVISEAYDQEVVSGNTDAPPIIWAIRCAALPSDPGHGLFGDRELIFCGEGSFWAAVNVFDHDISQMALKKSAQCRLLRDIFGNPFRSVSVDPRWLTSDVVALATGIYDEKAFDRMPILADALQDAGCDNDDILNHCRDANATHVRGCWVVDLLLGKS